MDPAQLIPTADAIPAAWPWFKALLIPCFALHLLFMNALLGTAVIGWAHAVRPGGRGLDTAGGIGKKLPFHMAFTINFGVAVLLFVQTLHGHLFYTSSILMAVWWISVPGLVLFAYAMAYWIDFQSHAPGGRWGLAWTPMVAALLLVAFVFVNNLTLMQDPASWTRYLQAPGGTMLHLADATLIPRYLHFVTASVAVGGLALAIVNRRQSADRTDGFMRWFTMATGMQFIIGGWFFFALPANIRLALVGGDAWATGYFALAMAAALASMAFGSKNRIRPTVGALLVTVLAMVLVRDSVRDLYLEPYFSPQQLTVHPQYGPMVVFGLFLAAGIWVAFYMVRLFMKGGARS